MTEKELAEMLRNNPELQVEGGSVLFEMDARTHQNRVVAIHPPRVKLSEHDFQAAVIAEFDRRSILRVEYGLIFAIPNGQYRQGQRMEPGLRPGVPDLFIPVARHGYHGCFVELKVSPNKETEKQIPWRQHLTAEGYLCRVFHDNVDEVVGFVEWYLEKK